jgi:hypothetical protein
MDANLWASLAVEIFFQLAQPTLTALDEEKARVEKQREQILRRLDTSRHLVAELAKTRELAEGERERIEAELAQARIERQNKTDILAKVVAEDVTATLEGDKELTTLLTSAADDLGMPELAAPELPGLVLLATHGSQWHGWASIGVALTAMVSFVATIRPVLAAVSGGLDKAEQALRYEEQKARELRDKQAEKQVKLEADLAGLVAKVQSLTIQLAAATAAADEARSEEKDLQVGRRLRRFLEERRVSSDYRGHLGLISLLHQDFRKLNAMLRLAGDNTGKSNGDSSNGDAPDDDLPRIDRIILYIDDLDRCPPAA